MCGLVGFSGFHDPALLQRMNDSITHRGPDDEGQAIFEDVQTSLAMRRLSIIDIAGGQQPFTSPCGKVTLVFNGEIYNYKELQRVLIDQGISLTTNSDTEVVLHCLMLWGLDGLEKLHGMFAFALLDRRSDKPCLIIARDRVGMKPLYYSQLDDKLIFGSDLKSLLCWDDLPKDIHLPSLNNYLTYRFVPKPHTLFTHIKKLPAGHVMLWQGNELSIKRWWSPPCPSLPHEDEKVTDEQALQDFEDAMDLAVKRHMVADVPVGVYLSGGVDSTAIAALMKKHHTGSNVMNSYTACFPDYEGNEGQEAMDTAKFLGMDSHLVECRADHMAHLPQIAYDLDEPVGDAIVLPMWLLGKETRDHNKVVLSGEGADEILGGYMFHKNLIRLQKLKSIMPRFLWPAIGQLFAMVPLSVLNRLFDYPGTFGTEGRQKLSVLLKSVPHCSRSMLLTKLVSLFAELEDITYLSCIQDDAAHDGMSDLSYYTQLHYDGWLEDNILWKSDKMTMAHSVEGRMPFMDEAVLKAAAALPDHLKLNPKGNKWALRQYAQKLMPSHLLDRPKKAFYVPLENYQNHATLRGLYDEYLSDARIEKRGLFNVESIHALKQPQQKAGFLPDKQLFAVLMLELWFNAFHPDWQHQGAKLL